MQSHPLHKGDREIKNCYVSHAQNAVRLYPYNRYKTQDSAVMYLPLFQSAFVSDRRTSSRCTIWKLRCHDGFELILVLHHGIFFPLWVKMLKCNLQLDVFLKVEMFQELSSQVFDIPFALVRRNGYLLVSLQVGNQYHFHYGSGLRNEEKSTGWHHKSSSDKRAQVSSESNSGIATPITQHW